MTILYTAPTTIRTFMKWGDQHPAQYDLSSLRLLGSVGEPISPEAWMCYRRVIGGDRCPVVDTWWPTETGAIMISPLLGRVDDVMNVSGHRISTTEVESALVSHPAVAEAAVVGASDPTIGQGIVAFVTVRGTVAEDTTSGDELVQQLRAHVTKEIGKIALPRQILITPELPRTRSGKIMRRLLRDVAEHRDLGDVTTLADPTVMNAIGASLQARGGDEG